MAEFIPHLPLATRLERFESDDDAGITITDIRGRAILIVFAAKGKIKAIEKRLGIGSKPGEAAQRRGFVAIPQSPGEWMLVSQNSTDDGEEFAQNIKKRIGRLGDVSQQSDGRIVLRLGGKKIAKLMEKLTSLDLFHTKKDFCAQTIMGEIGVMLHQISDKPEYELYAFSGYGEYFFEFVLHLAREYGVCVEVEDR